MPQSDQRQGELDERGHAFYRSTLTLLADAHIPFLVGGAYALNHYTGLERHTKDLDVFVRREHYGAVEMVLAAAGIETELTFPHWLGKASCEHASIDVIFSSGNGLSQVDDAWFAHAAMGSVHGAEVRFCPAEEMIWSKAFIMERERFDGADVAHVLRARADSLDWNRLLERFGEHYRVLLSHLILFGFIYPGEREKIPGRVMGRLFERVRRENYGEKDMCQGTLLSRQQYLTDIGPWELADARLEEHWMSHEDIAHWTAAIDKHR